LGHVDDHDRVAIRPLVILHPELIVPAAIEIRVLPAIVGVVASAVAFFAGVEFLKQVGLRRIFNSDLRLSAPCFSASDFFMDSLPGWIARKRSIVSQPGGGFKRAMACL
jgi:phosphatidylglycerophosphate synthase